MRVHFHCHFFLKKEANYQNGPITIYLRITVAGKRAEISTGKKIEPDQWIAKAGRMHGHSQLARSLNAHLIFLEQRLCETYYAMTRQNEVITAAALKNRYTGVDDCPKMLVQVFKKHNNRIAALVPKVYSAGTLERYKTSLSHTITFMQWKYNVSDFNVQDIDHDFITEYDFFLRSVRNCSNNTTVKYLKNFRKIIRICIANGWIRIDPFAMYQAKL